MDIIKKFFCLNNDDNGAIGLCRFNQDFFEENQEENQIKKFKRKDASLSEMLKKPI